MISRCVRGLPVCLALLVGCQQPSSGKRDAVDHTERQTSAASVDAVTDGQDNPPESSQPAPLVQASAGESAAVTTSPASDETAQVAAPAAPPQGPPRIEWQPDWDTARRAGLESGKPIMIDFHTDWCFWCKRLDRDTYPHADVVKLSTRQVSLKLNAEREGRELARKYGVRSYPTILYLTPAGVELGRVAGYLPAAQFVERAAAILDRHRGS